MRRAFGLREVLVDASLSLDARERVGLVGINGSGKSTLARILSGEDEPDGGEVVRRASLSVGYLSQQPRFETGATAVDAVLAGLTRWRAAIARHEAVSKRLEAAEDAVDDLLAEQAEAAAEVENLGGWEKRHEAAAILGQVGIAEIEADVGTMSGGEQRRVALAALLVAAPDLAILDEPTNHLDLAAVEWLEGYLINRFKGALILVTHDRYLLDRVVTRTFDVENGSVTSYDGGWAAYLEAKAAREAHEERAESNRRNFLRRELEWLRRSPKARTTKSKARVDRVVAEASKAPKRTAKTAKFALDHVREGQTILEAEDLELEIAGRTLVRDLTLRLTKGERIGIVGPNGCGKTTLLRALMGDLKPVRGRIQRGKNTKIAYLDQKRGGLDEDKTIFENVAEGRSVIEFGSQTLDVQTYLERFLFSRQQQRNRLSTLSGGERARVALARTLRDSVNLVILDEPTNDLDVTTLAALEEALLAYTGSVLVVTHDRWFLDRIATSLLVFEDGRATQYPGGYSDYVERRHSPRTSAATETATPKSEQAAQRKRSGLTYAERLELEGLLDRVDEAERKVAELEGEIANPEFYARTDEQRRDSFTELEQAKSEAAALAERWSELEERRDG